MGQAAERDVALAEPDARILALAGADRARIQGLLCAAAEHFTATGWRVMGVIEEIAADGEDVWLRDLVTGARHKLTQDLGPGAAGCTLDPAGLAAACALVQAAVDAWASEPQTQPAVVILSKFGRQEAEGRGLTHAFHAAVAADLPVLTSVSPTVAGQWEAFAGPLARIAPVEMAAVAGWQERLAPA